MNGKSLGWGEQEEIAKFFQGSPGIVSIDKLRGAITGKLFREEKKGEKEIGWSMDCLHYKSKEEIIRDRVSIRNNRSWQLSDIGGKGKKIYFKNNRRGDENGHLNVNRPYFRIATARMRLRLPCLISGITLAH